MYNGWQLGPNVIWKSPDYLAVSTQRGFLCWQLARSDLGFGMMLSPALGQINGTSFDFIPHPRRYLTAVFFVVVVEPGFKCIHSFHQAISQTSKLNSSSHDFWPTPGNDMNNSDCLLRLHTVALEQCSRITGEKISIHFLLEIFSGDIITGWGTKFLRNKKETLIWRGMFSEVHIWNRYQFQADVRFCRKIYILLGCCSLLDRNPATHHFGHCPFFFFHVAHSYRMLAMNI